MSDNRPSQPILRRLPPLKTVATYAGYMLAIYGAVALLFPIVRLVYQKVSFADAVAVARPFCERYVFPNEPTMPDAKYEDWRLVGVSLFTFARVEDARFHLGGLEAILRWHVHATHLSAQEDSALKASLPTDVVRGKFVSDPLPVLPDEAQVVVSAIALVESDDACRDPDLLTVTAVNGKVYTIDPRRGTIWHFIVPAEILTAAFIALILYAGYVLLRRVFPNRSAE